MRVEVKADMAGKGRERDSVLLGLAWQCGPDFAGGRFGWDGGIGGAEGDARVHALRGPVPEDALRSEQHLAHPVHLQSTLIFGSRH